MAYRESVNKYRIVISISINIIENNNQANEISENGFVMAANNNNVMANGNNNQ
jgi:hypothetical protein